MWYTKAAEQGDANAQYHLSKHYSQGIGVNLDKQQADHWYTQTAEQDHAKTLYLKWTKD